MKMKQEKDIDLIRRNYENRIVTDSKLAGQNLESLKMKYESQMASQKESYEDKLRQMQKNIDLEKLNASKSKA